jgi:hypothetical protein
LRFEVGIFFAQQYPSQQSKKSRHWPVKVLQSVAKCCIVPAVSPTESATFQSELRRYAGLIDPLIDRSVPFLSDDSIGERAMIYPLLLTGPWTTEKAKLVEPLISAGSAEAAAGRFTPFLIYAWLMAYRLAYETMPRETFGQWEEALRPNCEALENRLDDIDWPADGFSAADGAIAAEAVWIALALQVAGSIFVRDAWTDLSADVFGKLARGQQASGAFLRSSASDNPETLGYHELVLLHAAASYAVQATDRPLSVAVARAAEFHLNQMQPDHATTQPWALFAFIWHAPTRPLADQLLHASITQQPTTQTGIPAVLLADALYCLRLFL